MEASLVDCHNPTIQKARLESINKELCWGEKYHWNSVPHSLSQLRNMKYWVYPLLLQAEINYKPPNPLSLLFEMVQHTYLGASLTLIDFIKVPCLIQIHNFKYTQSLTSNAASLCLPFATVVMCCWLDFFSTFNSTKNPCFFYFHDFNKDFNVTW